MNNAALIGIHGLQADPAAGLHSTVSHSVGQTHQGIFPLGTVVFRVQRYPSVAFLTTVYFQAGQVLESIQGFATAADEDAQRVTVHLHEHVAILIIAHSYGYFHTHQAGHFL